MSVHERFIRRTYELARQAVADGNHPFGALLVIDDEVILTARNTVHTEQDVTRHAEFNLASAASRRFEPALLARATLYTSTEPCLMCCGAIYWARVRQVVFGVTAATLQTITGGQFVIPSATLFDRLLPRIPVVGPVLEAEGIDIHRAYWPDYIDSQNYEQQ